MLWKIIIAAAIFVVLWCLAIKPGKTHQKAELFREYRYAHRGLHNLKTGVPENSLAAFKCAAEHGYGAELDVHLTRDGRLVVMHDSNLKRICGVEAVIEKLTLEEVKGFHLYETEETIPQLSDVLEIFEYKAPLIIELKTYRSNHAALAEAVCSQLEGYGGKYCIESFDFRILMWLKKHRPEIMRGQLAGFVRRHGSKTPLFIDFMCRNMLTNFITRPNFVAYNYEDRNCPSISLCRRLWRVQEFSWTITTPEQLADAEKDGAIPIFEQFEP